MNLILSKLSYNFKCYFFNFKNLTGELRNKIPDEIWIRILTNLSPRALYNLSLVDRQFNLLSSDHLLWKTHCSSERILVVQDPKTEYLAYKKIEKLYHYSPFMQLVAKTISPTTFNQIKCIDDFSSAELPYVEEITHWYAFTFAFKCCDNNTGKDYTVRIKESALSRAESISNRHEIPFKIIIDGQKKKKFMNDEGLRLIYMAVQGVFLQEMK